jgi:hypothetical protein
MTVETQITNAIYVVQGLGPYPCKFNFIEPQDVSVFVERNAGQEVILQLGFDYTLQGQGNTNPSQITLSARAASLYDGWALYIDRETQALQPIRYLQQGPYSATKTEHAFDRQTMALQDVAFTLARSIKLSKLNRQVRSTEIQDVGASKVLQFTPDGTGIRAVLPQDIFLNQENAAINAQIQQLNHGFVVEQYITPTATGYILADSTSLATAESVGVVTQVIDADNFVVSSIGRATCFNNLIPGSTYFLGQKGQMSLTPNLTPGQINKPVLIADSSTSGFIQSMRGKINPDAIIVQDHSNVARLVTQANHGFVQDQALCFVSATKMYALATAAGTLEQASAQGVCVEVVDANNFYMVTSGYTTGGQFTGLGQLYLSETTPGLLTPTAPSVSGHYITPVIDCDSLTSGNVQIHYPQIINNGAGNTTPVSQNTQLQPGRIYTTYNNANGVTVMTLPTHAILGDTLEIVGYNNPLGWMVAQNANQQIHFLGTDTTRGINGAATSTTQNDCLGLSVTAVDSNSFPTDFVARTAMGNIDLT